MTRIALSYRLVLVVALTAITAACSTDATLPEGGGRVDTSVNVKPPPKVESLPGRVGLIFAGNSKTWPKLLDSAKDVGIVVLYVQPDGPAAGQIDRGDVITKVDNEPVSNAERARALLLSKRDQRRVLQVVKPDGTKKLVTIVARVPSNERTLEAQKVRDLDAAIGRTPDDAVAYFLRAQSTGVLVDRALADVDKAIELQPSFTEAVAQRATLLYNRSDNEKDAARKDEYRDRAFSDWELALRLDPQNTFSLVLRAQAFLKLRNAASAKHDGERAIAVDADQPGGYYAIAAGNLFLSKYREAAGPARRAVELNPYDARYYQVLAATFVRLKRQPDAKRTVEAIIDLIPAGATRENLLKIAEGKV